MVALEREHEQPVGARDRSLGVGEVAAEGRLAVGTGGDESEVRAKGPGDDLGEWQETLASRNHARRLMTLDELADAAAFLASDRASGLTGTTVNLIMGSLDD